MGCNCKKTRDKFKQYADNKEDLDREDSGIDQNIVEKVGKHIEQFLIGIITACLFIIIVIPLIIYFIICVLIGKDPTFIIRSPKRLLNRKHARKQ